MPQNTCSVVAAMGRVHVLRERTHGSLYTRGLVAHVGRIVCFVRSVLDSLDAWRIVCANAPAVV